MTSPMLVVRTLHRHASDDEEPVPIYRDARVYCPGCDGIHNFTIEVLDPDYRRGDGSEQPVWSWDGNRESPTFDPSMLAYSAVHLCAGEHEFYVCEQATEDGGFENCEHTSHGYGWRFPDGTIRTYKVWETKPDEAEQVVTCGSSPHPRDPAWGNCHSYLKNGVWEFLGDSAHKLAGQKVPMVPLPDFYYGGGE